MAAVYGEISVPDTNKNTGLVVTTSCSYISGTGTAGTDNTAMIILTNPPFTGGIMTQVGDRTRIRAYYQATGGGHQYLAR